MCGRFTLSEIERVRVRFGVVRIIPVEGFYEWQAVPGECRKQPMHIRLAGGRAVQPASPNARA